jgi:hypothetical protein
MKHKVSKESMGKILLMLLPSVKMKSRSPRGIPFAQEFHEFLMIHFNGYTVASGNITGYWQRGTKEEQCNEHRQYQVAFKKDKDRLRLEQHLSRLASELGEKTIFCQFEGEAYLVECNPETEL